MSNSYPHFTAAPDTPDLQHFAQADPAGPPETVVRVVRMKSKVRRKAS